MVMIDTKLSTLSRLIGNRLSAEQLSDILFDLGMELSDVDGDNIKIELTAERSDLISEHGLARALSAYLGKKTGLPKCVVNKSNYSLAIDSNLSEVKVEVNKGLQKSWSYAVCAVVKGLKFNDERIKDAIRVQEKLGEAYLRNRKKGGIGLYPLEKIKFPIRFTAVDADKINFRPLEYPRAITGRQILSQHPTGREYAHLIESNKKFPIFIDSAGTIMSMPPIINSHDVGKLDETTRDIFIEATGVELQPLLASLNIIVTMFAEMGGKVYGVNIRQGNKKFTTPDLKPISRTVNYDRIEKLLGVKISQGDVKKLLARMMYDSKVNGKKISVLAPAFRTDLWHEVDVIDDIMRAHGVNNIALRLPNVASVGGLLNETKFTDSIREYMIGLGFQEIITRALTNETDQFTKMNISEQQRVIIANALESSLSCLRTWLMPEAFKALNKNRSTKLPIRVFEIGDVTLPDKNSDVLAKEVTKLACLICATDANYTDIKSVLTSVLNYADVKYAFVEAENGAFISGRCAAIHVNGEQIGIVGELHPKVIANWNLETPMAGFELYLNKLMPVRT